MIRLAVWLLAPALSLAAPPLKVQVRTAGGAKIVELPVETYVADVLAGESSVFQSSEALKAMSVAARTYAIRMRGRHASDGFDFCDTTHCQRLVPDAVSARLESAANDTAGEMLWYRGRLAFTPYSRDCGGLTEDARAVWPDLAQPYLGSHSDSYCVTSRIPPWHWSGESSQIAAALRNSGLHAPDRIAIIEILERTPSGRAETLLLAGSESIRISASSFRFAIGRALGWNTIRSERYAIQVSNGRFLFEGTGAGHAVGLCQDGAEQMGRSGKTYREILGYYYPGTVVGLTGRGIAWQRLSGETVTVWTTQPGQDGAVLAESEQLVRAAAQRTGWPAPDGIEVRIYPDIEAFRNATGEPGWVAAHTVGHRVDVQSAAGLQARNLLETTLAHELWHILIESQGGPALPLWFREGMADYLAGVQEPATARIHTDAEFRQRSDAAAARRAYADSAAMVRGLVQRYGEATVLAWVKRGLPPAVANASNSQAARKSR